MSYELHSYFHQQLILSGQILLSFILGALIGLERELHQCPAGIRTYAAVSIGSCLFGIISIHAHGLSHYTVADPTRIAAQIVSGIGFLGAGVIFREKQEQNSKTSGLTTAATIWTTAAIGLGIAFENYLISVLTSFLVLFLLFLNHLPFWKKFQKKHGKKTKLEN